MNRMVDLRESKETRAKLSTDPSVVAILQDSMARVRMTSQKAANRMNHAISTVCALMNAASKAQDTNADDFVLGRPDVSHLPEGERAAFLRGWDAAAEAVYGTGLRAALAMMRGENQGGAE